MKERIVWACVGVLGQSKPIYVNFVYWVGLMGSRVVNLLLGLCV